MRTTETVPVQLGQEVQDKISGFKGIAVARVEWLYGCVRIGVAPKVNKDGKADCAYFDEPQLKIVGKGVRNEVPETRTYGPRDDETERGARP